MSYQPFPVSVPPAVPASRPRRNPVLLVVGIVVLVAGVVGGVVLLMSASSSTEDSVKKLARAPAGCTTTLDFDSAGTFLVFFEQQGTVSGLDGDCAGGDGSYGRSHGDVPDQTLTLAGPDGQAVSIDDASGASYDAGGFVGTQIGKVQIDGAGEYRLTVSPDDPSDTNYAVAIGKDPTGNEDTLRIAGFAVLIGGVVIGALLIVFGLLRRGGPVTTPAAAVPWAPAGPQPAVWPPAAPTAPPYGAPPPPAVGPVSPWGPAPASPPPGGAPYRVPSWSAPPSGPPSGPPSSPDDPTRQQPTPDPFSRPPQR